MTPILHLGQGKAFGELALQYDPANPTKVMTRAASCLCLENCMFVKINKQDYRNSIQRLEQRKHEKVQSFMQTIPLFGKVSDHLLGKLRHAWG
jgi:hypothetical protein